MREGWKEKKLEELADEKKAIVSGPFGSNLKVSDYRDSGVPIIRLQNVGKGYFIEKDIKYIEEEKAEELKSHSFVTGDIVLAKLGIPIGKTCIIPDSFSDGIILADIVRIRPDRKRVSYKFLEYFLNTDLSVSQLTKNISGATRPRVNLSNVRSIIVPIPPLKEQKQIVSTLNKAFKQIDQAKANLEQNLHNAKELFQSKLNEVFSQRGEGWVEKRLEEACVLQRGFDLPKRLRTNGKYLLVSSSGISDTHNEYKVKAPGVTTGRSGTIGKLHYIEDDFWPLNTVLYIKDFHGNNERFIYYLLQYFDLKKYATGAGVPTLNRNFVHHKLVSIPSSLDIQKEIVDILDKLLEYKKEIEENYQQKLNNLEELKKSILQKAFRGEL